MSVDDGPGGARRRVISVVVPVYYNDESLPSLFEALRGVEDELARRDLDLELIFVDDGSRDHSLATLLAFKQRRPATRIVKLTRNFGAVHASKTGLRWVTGDAFLILAADLQDPPGLVVQMVDRWLAGAKYVVCAREARDDHWRARAFAAVYYRLVRWLVITDYPSGGYDLALMDRAMLTHMIESAKNINTPLYAYWLGFTPEVIGYTRQKRQHGASRWTFAKRITFFIDSLLGFSIVPIRLMSVIGAGVSICSFGYGTWMVVNGILHRVSMPGFATIVVLIAFLLGLILFMLGVLGEYLWRIFVEVSRRPETVVETVY